MTSPVRKQLQLSYVEISKFVRPLVKRRLHENGPSYVRGNAGTRNLGAAATSHRFSSQITCLRQRRFESTTSSGFLERYKTSLYFPESTHHINDLPHVFGFSCAEEKVILHGYLGKRRDLSKKLSFVMLNDSTYNAQVQVISLLSDSTEEGRAAHETLRSIPMNTPVVLQGTLRSKPESDRRSKGYAGSDLPVEDIEVVLQGIQSLNDFPSDIIMTPDTEFPPEQRHLQVRSDGDISQALVLRSRIKTFLTNILSTKYDFTEVETPILFKSTSEGAREFIVPTRRRGLAYALPQSPQQFKQILMSSGIRDYYQFAKCFRDEDLRFDRQPEFTQLDIERSFANGESVMTLIEDLVRKLWNFAMNIELPETFPRLTYDEAMSRYGSDKPDLRIPIKGFKQIQTLLPADLVSMITPLKEPIIDAMVVPIYESPSAVRNFIRDFLDLAENKIFLHNPNGGPGIFVYDSSKPLQGLSAFGFMATEYLEKDLDLKDGHLIVLQARTDTVMSGGSTPLGDLRTAIHKAAVCHGLLEPPSWTDFRPTWVVDFPLFCSPNAAEPGQGGNAGLASTHHPFTSPKSAADVDCLFTEPTKAIGDHYDLVINGEEIGGGSRRIHQAEMQEHIFRDILKMDEGRIAEFSHLLSALRSGCPPHSGIALGFDRLVAMIQSSRCGRKMSLRDVIAFPKSNRGEDLMVQSPGPMSPEDLKTYHLQLRT